MDEKYNFMLENAHTAYKQAKETKEIPEPKFKYKLGDIVYFGAGEDHYTDCGILYGCVRGYRVVLKYRIDNKPMLEYYVDEWSEDYGDSSSCMWVPEENIIGDDREKAKKFLKKNLEEKKKELEEKYENIFKEKIIW
jgi:hypothetical protein